MIVCICVCPATNLLSAEHTNHLGEENTAILLHSCVILSLYPSFSTPMLFVSALLSSLLLFLSLCYVLFPSAWFILHHSLFSVMSVPRGQFLFSFFPSCFPLYHSTHYIYLPPLQAFYIPLILLSPAVYVLLYLLIRHLIRY